MGERGGKYLFDKQSKEAFRQKTSLLETFFCTIFYCIEKHYINEIQKKLYTCAVCIAEGAV